ncbi:MAG: acetyl-CoA carboxylase carboxyltransferase subunit alpha [Peptococcaceae bacterium]|nr:acetyl-CoA carboxylase carboxyltransferase subunit alpha [Peptococcaceae bacterium]
MAQPLEFEKPLVELEAKIRELKSFAEEKELDLSDEIITLENKATSLQRSIYGNLTAWQKTQIARQPDRPNFYDYVQLLFTDFVELHGDRAFADDQAIAGGIAFFNGTPVTVVGHAKGKDTKENIRRNFAMPHPEGYRKALRLMRQADKFGRPIITFIDTQGAYSGLSAEERGQGEAIARNLIEMSMLKVPVISVVIGEGGSGGALALGVGDRLLMLEHTFYSVIAPESCAAILWRDAAKAKEAAEAMKFTAQDLLRLGICDEIVPEPLGGAQRDYAITMENLSKALQANLTDLCALDTTDLLNKRYAKIRQVGVYSG